MAKASDPALVTDNQRQVPNISDQTTKKMVLRRTSLKSRLWELLKKIMIMALWIGVGIRLGRVELFGRLQLGLAYSAAWLGTGPVMIVLPIAISVVFGRISGMTEEGIISTVALYLGFWSAVVFIKGKKKYGALGAYGIVFLIISGLFFIWVKTGSSDLLILSHFCEMIVNYPLYLALSSGVSRLLSTRPDSGISKRTAYSIGLMSLFSYLALREVTTIYHLQPSFLFALLVILLTAKRYGIQVSSIFGLTFSLGEVLSEAAAPWEVMLIAGSGFLAGLGKEFGDLGLGLGFLVNLVLIFARWQGAEGIRSGIFTALLAYLLFLVTSLISKSKIEKYLPDFDYSDTKREIQKRFQELAIEKMQALSDLFTDLSTAYAQQTPEKKGEKYDEKAESIWKKRFEEGKVFLSIQLKGVSGMMERLSKEIRLDIDFRKELARELKAELLRMGFTLKNLEVISIEGHIELLIEKRSCGRQDECREILAPIISQLLGRRFIPASRVCRVRSGYCCSRFSSGGNYRLQVAVGKTPREGNEFSGDSFSLIDMVGGYSAVILSDGMGVGAKAAGESSITVSLVERLLAAGMDKQVTLQLVNSMLLLRSTEENFATLDLFLLDQVSAMGEFIKIGAAPTYMKRGKEISVVRSMSLPAGIINNIEPEYFRYQLCEDDIIVMVTDGVHSFQKADEGDWMIGALKKIGPIGADPLCRYLKQSANERTGGKYGDDMMVAVLQIVKEKMGTERNNFG